MVVTTETLTPIYGPRPHCKRNRQTGEAVCANLSGFKLRLSPRAIMDIRPLLSSITRRPQEGPWRRTRLQKCRWNRFSIRPFRLANQAGYCATPIAIVDPGRSCILCGVSQEIGVVVTTLCEHAPGRACEFCGQGNDQYIRVEPLGRCFQPGSEAVLGPGLAPQKYGSGPLNE